jgi:4-hydroxybenzoate polyprenyltransferase
MVGIPRRRRREDGPETPEAAPDPSQEGPDDVPHAADDAGEDDGADAGTTRPFSLRNLTPLLLLRAAHPRQAVLTALAVGGAAALAGRPAREMLLVMGTVLVGQSCLGWFNDLVDRARDARHDATGKPVADGRLDPGTVWFVLAVGVFVVVPLSVANGVYAGSAYLISLAVAVLGTWRWIRTGFLSWLPWAASFGLLPAFLSYGGWGGQDNGAPPEVLVTVLAAALGIGVHFLRALWGLVPDNADGWTYLPLKLGLRLGASRLLWVSTVYTVAVVVGLAFAATSVGLAQ